jgi:uncharacterized protein (DUF1800 family)
VRPRRTNQAVDPGDAWAPYEPNDEAPWDLRRVVHLHRRAGFGATWAEIRRDIQDGPEASVERVLCGRSRSSGAPADFESVATLLADEAVAAREIDRLRAWWVYRMLFSPDPLGERMTLLWHDHFATAVSKVEDVDLLRRQNEIHRRLGRKPFAELLDAEVREPALLLYLDAPENRKGHPNENLARELMELFTLGIGHYSETDVKEAARALTGWTVEEGRFQESARRHDDGEKTILGRSGRWTGGDLVRMLDDHPATARRLAGRLCGLFMGEKAVSPTAVDALAEGLSRHDLDLAWGIRTVLRSRAFFDQGNLSTRVLGPVEYVVGACRALLPDGVVPLTLLLSDWIGQLGQDLFDPPNVGGWPGGRSWLTSRSIIGRANFAAELIQGRPLGLPGPLDAEALAAAQGRGTSIGDVLDAASALLCGALPSPETRRRLEDTIGGPSPDAARRAVATVLASPGAQLG